MNGWPPSGDVTFAEQALLVHRLLLDVVELELNMSKPAEAGPMSEPAPLCDVRAIREMLYATLVELSSAVPRVEILDALNPANSSELAARLKRLQRYQRRLRQARMSRDN
jgi:hypothetical protein